MLIAGIASPASGWSAPPSAVQAGLLLLTFAALLGSSVAHERPAQIQKKRTASF
ncbi:hypothetical protein ABZX12_17645 [Kribbella sp. NPDC003505]|uniref:hypothetical protein n=1 Tax=Kribbella sp. NPDC003505 TaxID=3154448 RepID=UPI00339F02EF